MMTVKEIAAKLYAAFFGNTADADMYPHTFSEFQERFEKAIAELMMPVRTVIQPRRQFRTRAGTVWEEMSNGRFRILASQSCESIGDSLEDLKRHSGPLEEIKQPVLPQLEQTKQPEIKTVLRQHRRLKGRDGHVFEETNDGNFSAVSGGGGQSLVWDLSELEGLYGRLTELTPADPEPAKPSEDHLHFRVDGEGDEWFWLSDKYGQLKKVRPFSQPPQEPDPHPASTLDPIALIDQVKKMLMDKAIEYLKAGNDFRAHEATTALQKLESLKMLSEIRSLVKKPDEEDVPF